MNVKEKLKRVLTEWNEFELPPLYERNFNYSLLDGKEILSIIGARRTGKTYLCYQLIKKIREKLPKENVLYINFEDERLFPLSGEELTLLWETYLELFSVDQSKRIFLFVDEIQNVNNWSKWARRITEQNKKIKLVITGSSSKLLSREIATELRGRTLSFTLFPLSFGEYLGARNITFERKNLLYTKERIAVKKAFNEYFERGGFPAIVDNENYVELLREYYKVMFYRDLIERYGVKNIRLFEDYLALVVDQVGSLFSISATAKKLENFGYSLSKNTLSNFSKYSTDVFLIFEVQNHTFKLKERIRRPKKIYAIDHGLIKTIRLSISEDYSRLLENIVFLSLRRKYGEVFYFGGAKECDFLVSENGRIKSAIQVTKSISSEDTKKRELAGLLDALSFYHLKEGFILTEDESDSFTIDGKKVNVLPIWYWLL